MSFLDFPESLLFFSHRLSSGGHQTPVIPHGVIKSSCHMFSEVTLGVFSLPFLSVSISCSLLFSMLRFFPLYTHSGAIACQLVLAGLKGFLCFGLNLKCPPLAQFVVLGTQQVAMLKNTGEHLGSRGRDGLGVGWGWVRGSSYRK